MVAVVSGSSLGLFPSSASTLGAAGSNGDPTVGRGGDRVYVNAATGNLVVQSVDERLSALGLDVGLVRTYNSQGLMDDDNGDNWRLGVHERVYGLTGTLNTAGSTVHKVFGDGADVLYRYDTTLGRYVSTDGDRAHDTLSNSAGTWTWTDGSDRNTETYNASGQLTQSKDTDGNTVSYTYTGSLLTQITDASGQTTYLDYTGNNLTQIRVVSSGVTQTLTRYTYDGSNRLTQVKVDLSPSDNSVTDNNVYTTTYTYDSTSKRIASITQSDGSSIAFTYELAGGQYRVKMYTDGEGRVTTLTYTSGSGSTSVNANSAVLSTTDTQNYALNTAALTSGGTAAWSGPTVMESSSTGAASPRVAFDDTGNGFMVWREGGNLYARRYTRANDTWAAQVALDSLSGTVSVPVLAIDNVGNALAAWVQNDGTTTSLYARRYDVGTGSWGTTATLESSAMPMPTTYGTASAAINGSYAAVAFMQANVADGSSNCVFAAHLNGGVWTTSGWLDPYAPTATRPTVAIDNQGNATVVFQQSDGQESILQSRFTMSSGAWSTGVLLESSSAISSEAKIAFDANGNGFAVWAQGPDVVARRYTRATNTWSSPITIDSRADWIFNPSLAVDAAGNALVAWAQSDGTATSAYAARFDAGSGTWSAPQLLETAAGGVGNSDGGIIASINGSYAAVVWRQSSGSVTSAYAARYAGGTWSSAVALEADESTNIANAEIAIDSQGNISTVWQQSDGTAVSIYHNRYGNSGGPAYYLIPASATWQSVANTLYSVNSTAAGAALQTAMGNPALTAGNQLTALPSTLSVTTSVPAYYTVQAGNTWATITQTVYGTSDANALAALQAALGNPTLTTGLRLTVPSSLTYTPVGGGSGLAQTDVQSALGFVASYQTDSNGRLMSVFSPAVAGTRIETRYAYDADGNVTAITEDPTGLNRVTALAYDTRGNLLSTRDSLGNTVTRTYDTNNQVLTEVQYLVRDPDGAGAGVASSPLTTRYAYDGESHLRFIISADGRVTEHVYNAAGQRTNTFKYVGALYTATLFAESDLVTWTGAQNKTLLERTDYAYDFRGNVSSISAWTTTTSAGAGSGTASITRMVYDQRGQLLQTIDARGEATTADANDYRTAYTYDGLGRVLSTTQWVSGSSTTTTLTSYDDANRRTVTTLANGLISASTYDRTGALLSVVNGSSGSLGTTSYKYDADGRLRITTDPTGVRQFYLYDEAGRKVAYIDGDGTLTEFIYNRASQLIKTVQYAAVLNSTALATLVDASGNPLNPTLASLRTAAGGNAAQDRVTRNVYDAAGLLVYTLDEAGDLTQYFYDGAGRVTDEVRYATPVNIARTVDEVLPGSFTVTTSADDRRTRNFYDNDGHLVATLDGGGYLVEYTYDAAGHLTQQIGYANQTSSTYWLTGTLAQLRPAADNETATDPEQDIRGYFFYDGQGRQVGVLDGEGYLTETVYDLAGNVSQSIRYNRVLTYTAGSSTFATLKTAAAGATTQTQSYLFDGARRVTQETNYEGTITTYTYDAVGNLLSTTRAQGASEARTTEARYDFLGRVTQELTAEGRALITVGMTQTQIDDIWSKYGVTYAYDLAGRKISATVRPNDSQTNVTRYYYDNDDRLRFEVNQIGERKEYRYNALNQLTDEILYYNRIATAGLNGGLLTSGLITTLTASADAAKDTRTTYTYTLTGKVASTASAEGASTTYTYNAFGEQSITIQQIDATRSLRHEYTYNTRGLLTLTRWDPTAINTTEGRAYDAFGRLTAVTDARNNTARIEYDRLGRQIATVDVLNGRHVTTYDGFSRTLTTRDALLNTTSYGYNDSTRTMTVTTPEGIVVTTVHNRHGQTLTVAAGGNTTTYAYDPNGQLSGVSDTLGTLEGRTYDRAGRQLTATDARGTTTSFAYDAANRVLTRTVDSAGGGLSLVTTYVYDGEGRVDTVTEPSGRLTKTTYDRDGRVTQIAVDPSGLNLRTAYAYDRQGHVITVTEGSGSSAPRRTQYLYDTLGRRTEEIVDPTALGGTLNLRTQYKYDANGNLTRKIDGNGNSTWYVYDTKNRVTHTIDALGGVTQTLYDAEDQLVGTRRYATAISVASFTDVVASVSVGTNTMDRLTQSVYDRDGREVYSINAVGGVTERTYDALGNVTRTRAYANAIPVTAYATTAAVSTALTTAGNNTGTIGANDRVQWTAYDVRGRAAFDIDGTGAVTQSQYDVNGNVAQTTAFATLRSTSLATDLASVQSWATSNASNTQNRTTRYWYDTTDRLRFTLDAEGYVTEARYNDSGRQESGITYAAKPTVAAGATLANVVSAVGTIANATVDQTTTTLYDAAGRVSRVTDAYGNYEEYTYDAVGNKLTYRNQKGDVWNYVYDAAGRLLDERSPQVQITSLTDAGASLTSATATASIVTRMTYDGLGNVLTRTEGIRRFTDNTENATGSRVTAYLYDVLGRQTRTTLPAVGVYNPATDDLNRAGTAVVRSDTTPQTLYSEITYDTLGDAFRNRDVAGNYSYKTYDALGRVQYEIDAENYVTRYTYDAFGNQLKLTRYSNFVSSAAPTSGGSSVSVTADSAKDRTITTTYDKLDRVIQVTQPATLNFETVVGVAGGTSFTAGATTLSEYNAFGQVVRSRRLVNPSTSQYADTYFYYDRRGLKTAEVDPLKNLTSYEYDETEDLTRQVEYARALTGTVTTASYGSVLVTTPASAPNNASGYDRETLFAYDRLNRKISETKVGVEYTSVSGTTTTTATGNQVTTFGYDAVDNQTVVTANGASTFTYYDALGRVIAIAMPTRDVGNGTNLTPLTLMRRDVYGNLVEQIQYANGASTTPTTASVPTATVNAANDRTTRILVDAFGRAIRTEDAAGNDRFASYTARGEVAKEWQIVTNTNDNTVDAIVTLYEYDKLGRQRFVTEPQRISGGVAVNVKSQADYNAFGEVIRKGVLDGGPNNGTQEYFDYDQAGRVWRTNSGDGVDKVYAYNLAGQATAEIKSDTQDLATFVSSVSAALGLSSVDQIRTETVYDLAGRVLEQREASFPVANALEPINATFQFGALATPVPPEAVYQFIPATYFGSYVVNPVPWEQNGGYYQVAPPSSTNPLGTYARVAQSSYQLTQASHIYWTAPSELGLTKTFEYRVAGSSTWTQLAVKQVTATQLGANVSGLTAGNYEFQVKYTRAGDSAAYAAATGTFSISQSTTTTLSVSTNAAVAALSLAGAVPNGATTTLMWFSTDPSVTASLELRAAGSSTWQSYGVTYSPPTQYTPATFTAAVPTVGGNYEYRVVHKRSGVTVAMGTGTLSIVSANTTSTGTNTPDAAWTSITPLSASGSNGPGGNPSVTIAWTDMSGPTNIFSYRVLGTTTYTPVFGTASGGVVRVSLGALAAGTYEYTALDGVVTAYGTSGSSATGRFTVTGSSATITSQVAGAAPFTNVNPISASVVVPPPVVTTTIQWAVPSGIAGVPAFTYRPLGGSTWTSATVSTSGGVNYVSFVGLGGTYEYSLNYVYAYGSYASATGQFAVSGASASILSQSNWTLNGGTATYLSGVSASGDRLNWAYTPQAGDSISVTYTNTSSGATGSLSAQTSNGTNYWASFYGLVSGTYRYQISYIRGGVEYVRGSGSMNVTTTTAPASATTGSPASPGQITGFIDYGGSTGYLVWSTLAEAGASIVFRYKASGAANWAGTLSWWAWSGGYAVDLSVLSGAIDYEVTYTRAGQYSPYMIGNGSTTIVRTTNTNGSVSNTTASSLADQTMTPKLSQVLDRWGNVLALTDALGNTTNYRYNQYGQLVEQLLPTATIVSTVGGVVSTTTGRATSRNYYDIFGRLIATRDANGNPNRASYNTANQLISETHADNEYQLSIGNATGAVKRYVYDAFDQQIQITDELGYRTRNVYDKVGQLKTLAQEVTAGGFTSATPSSLAASSATSVRTLNYEYDGAGRRLSETNGDLMASGTAQETTRYWYDLQGNLIKRRTPRGRDATYEYDLQGRKTRETDALGNYSSWVYNYFGQVTSHRDLGGAVYTYVFDAESGWLRSQTSNLGQSIVYSYDAVGHLKLITERSVAVAGSGLANVTRDTSFSYDVAGRRIRERTVVDGLVHQDTHIAYDQLGRVSQLSDLRYRDAYSYDAQGNRTRITATYFDHAGAQKTDNLWYTYDAMNRVNISQGVNSAGTVVLSTTQGIDLTYDAKGQRTSATTWGKRLELTTTMVVSAYGTFPITTYAEVASYSKESYAYDALGRLLTTHRQAHQTITDASGTTTSNDNPYLISTRQYDGGSRETREDTTSFEASGSTLTLVTRARTSTYDDDGQLINQTTLKNNIKESYIVYGDSTSFPGGTYTISIPFGGTTTVTLPASYSPGFDAAGNLRGYVVSVYDTNTADTEDVAYTSTYQTNYRLGETYQESGQSVSSTSGGPLSGSTARTYNVNGELVQFTDTRDQAKNRYFANNAQGQALTVVQGQYDGQSGRATALQAMTLALSSGGAYNTTKAQHFFFANGQQVGSFGQLTENGQFAANFDVNFTPVSQDYPANTPSEIVVQKGDTLRAIAARVFGDATLWYLIAEENGLSDPDVELEAGSVVRIPNDVVSLSNTSSSYKPFNPAEALGDTSPTQPLPPPPKKKKGCGVLGMILVIVVAVVVTVFSAGAAAGALGVAVPGATGTFATGLGVLSGAAGFGGAALGAAAIGGAVGSIASQGVAIAAGLQDGFSWKGVALGALGATVGAGLGAAAQGSTAVAAFAKANPYTFAAANAAASNAITQGVAVATGLQNSFDWKSVAVAAISAPLGKALGDKVGFAVQANYDPSSQYASVGKFAHDVVNGLTSSVVRAASGGKLEAQSVLADAFGNAIGNAIVGRMSFGELPGNLQAAVRAVDGDQSIIPKYFERESLYRDTLGLDAEATQKSLNRDLGFLVDPSSFTQQAQFDHTNEVLTASGAPKEAREAILDSLRPRAVAENTPVMDTPAQETSSAEPTLLDTIVVTASRRESDLSWIGRMIRTAQDPLVSVANLSIQVGTFIEDHAWARWGMTALEIAAGPLAFAARRLVMASPVGTAINQLTDAAMEASSSFVNNEAQLSDMRKAGLITVGALAVAGIALAGARWLTSSIAKLRAFLGRAGTESRGTSGWTTVSRDARAIVRDIEEQTGISMPRNQRLELSDHLRDNEHRFGVSRAEYDALRAEYRDSRSELIRQWEAHTGQSWPRTEAGVPYQAHHVIGQRYGGPNEWWNIHPARFPDQHQGGIHRSGSPTSTVFPSNPVRER